MSFMTSFRSVSGMTAVRIMTPRADVTFVSLLSSWMTALPRLCLSSTCRTWETVTGFWKDRSMMLPPVKSIPMLKPRKIMEP